MGRTQGPVVSLSFAANNQLLSASPDGSVKLWQAPTPANASCAFLPMRMG